VKITAPSASRAAEGYRLAEAAKKCARMTSASTLEAGAETQFLDAFDEYIEQVIRRYEAQAFNHGSDENPVRTTDAAQTASPLVLTLDWISAAMSDLKRQRQIQERNAEAIGLRATEHKPEPKITDDPVIASFVSQLKSDAPESPPETQTQRLARFRKELLASMGVSWTEFQELGASARDLGRRPPLVIEWAQVEFDSLQGPSDLDKQVARIATDALRAALAGSREGETLLKKRAAVLGYVSDAIFAIKDESQYDANLAPRLIREASEKLGISPDVLVIEWVTAGKVRGEADADPPVFYTISDPS